MTSTLEAPTTADATRESAARLRSRLGGLTRDRLGLGVLLILTAITYVWNITVNGMAWATSSTQAPWAGSKNWEALRFGSVDPNNFITVDKPPVSQWVMGLSGQIFGFSSAGMLVPEALMAVASVALLYGAVRRVAGRNAGLLAGALFALTPVVALMFHGDDDSNNAQLDQLLKATNTQWSAAINGSSAAAGLELSTNTAVMAIGGFSGSDPIPSLNQFQADVADHRIGYYIALDPTRGFGRGRQHIDITRWVETTFPAVKAGSATVYDLSTPLR